MMILMKTRTDDWYFPGGNKEVGYLTGGDGPSHNTTPLFSSDGSIKIIIISDRYG